jgi:AcrR family transcriptional regulator
MTVHYTDRRSNWQSKLHDVTRPQRSDAARNRAAVLAAADELFATAAAPARVSMDDVAAGAGVGKGTLFRAFGSRAGLIQALWALRTEPLRRAIESGPPPLGPGTEPRQRIAAILDAILVAKLDNRHLTLAVEERSSGTSLYEQPQYQLVHLLLRDLLRDAGRGEESGLLAHLLLAAVRADLLDHLIGGRGRSRRQLRAGVAAVADLVLNGSSG